MYRIGDFSSLSKVTIKALRYYEKEGLLIPAFVDKQTGYRFYKTSQLLEVSKIVSLRQVGISIQNIKKILNNKTDVYEVLKERKKEVEKELLLHKEELSKINCILEGKEMKYEAVVRELPKYVVYYKEGVIASFADITPFILQSAEECKRTNPEMKCIDPDYCYISYLDGIWNKENVEDWLTEIQIPIA